MVKPFILIPPSEGKSSGGTQPCWLETDQSFKNLETPRLQVVSSLIKAMKEPESDRAKLLGVKGKKVAEATLANRDIQKAKTLPIFLSDEKKINWAFPTKLSLWTYPTLVKNLLSFEQSLLSPRKKK